MLVTWVVCTKISFFTVSTCFVRRMCQFVELVCFKSIYVNRYICPSIRTCEIFSLLLIKFVLMSWIFFAQNMTNASTMNTAAAAPRQYVSTYLGLTCITKRRKSCCFWCVGQTWLMRWQLQTNYANNHCLRLKSLTLFWFSQLTVCVLHQQQLRKTAWWFSLSLSLTL